MFKPAGGITGVTRVQFDQRPRPILSSRRNAACIMVCQPHAHVLGLTNINTAVKQALNSVNTKQFAAYGAEPKFRAAIGLSTAIFRRIRSRSSMKESLKITLKSICPTGRERHVPNEIGRAHV